MFWRGFWLIHIIFALSDVWRTAFSLTPWHVKRWCCITWLLALSMMFSYMLTDDPNFNTVRGVKIDFSIFSLKYSIKLSDWMTTPPLNTTNDRPLLKAERLSNPTLQPPVQNEKVITLWRNIWKMINFSRCLCQLLLVYSGHEFASVWIRSGLGCRSRSTPPCFQMHHYNSTTLCFSVSQWIAVVDSSFREKRLSMLLRQVHMNTTHPFRPLV